MLPSEALRRANTLDLGVLDISAKFSIYQQSDKYKKNKGYTEKDLLQMIERTRDGKKD